MRAIVYLALHSLLSIQTDAKGDGGLRIVTRIDGSRGWNFTIQRRSRVRAGLWFLFPPSPFLVSCGVHIQQVPHVAPAHKHLLLIHRDRGSYKHPSKAWHALCNFVACNSVACLDHWSNCRQLSTIHNANLLHTTVVCNKAASCVSRFRLVGSYNMLCSCPLSLLLSHHIEPATRHWY